MTNSRAPRDQKGILTSQIHNSYSTNAAIFSPIGNSSLGIISTTESVTQITITYEIVITKQIVNIVSNDKSHTTVLAIRDDGASIDAISVTATSTGEYSTTTGGTIAAGSKINFMQDTVLSSSGSILVAQQVAEYK